MFILDPEADFRASPQPMAMEQDMMMHIHSDESRKKRKRDEPDVPATMADSLAALSNYYAANPFTPAPSSPSTFTDMHNFDNSFYSTPPLPQHAAAPSKPESHISKRIHLSPRSRRPPTPASQPSFEHKTPHHHHSNATITTKPFTSPCHVCFRRPITTTDLLGYQDCEICSERTCFVCIRICEGLACQATNNNNNNNAWQRGGGEGVARGRSFDTEGVVPGRTVCGKCCVEVGSGGRIWCLRCYEDEETPLPDAAYKFGPTKKELQADSVGRIAAWLDHCGGDEAFE